MIKMICDFCQHDTNKLITIKVPIYNRLSAYNKDGVKLVELEDKDIIPKEKDICETCARRMIKAIDLMKIINDD